MRSNIRRLCALLLALTIALALAGCGKGDPTVANIRRGAKAVEPEAFKDNLEIKTAVIPDSVTTIGMKAFYGCENLESVVIPDSVTVIEPMAFEGCESLKSVELPDSLVTLGNSAFAMCYSLAEVTIPGSVVIKGEDEREWHEEYGTEDYGVFSSCHSLTTVRFGEGLQRIGPDWFDFCDALTSVEIPDSVISIEESAFESCRSLTSVRFGGSVETIGRNAFRNCAALTAVDLPGSVRTIGVGAFNKCPKLEQVRMSDGIETVDREAFLDCAALASVDLPGSLSSLSDVAFRGTPLMKGAEELVSGDWEGFKAGLETAEDLTGAEGPLPELSGKRVMPIIDHGDVCVNGALFSALPTDVRTIDWREADCVLYVDYTSEERDDYIGFANNKTSYCWLWSKDGGAKLLFRITHQPPVSGYGILNGDEATPQEIWEGIRRFFGK